jgi:hypothetical protein
MSHPSHRYPVVASRVLPVWTVREPDPDEDLPTLLDLTDRITERLAKAEALTRLLIHNDTAPEYLPDAASAIADLIGGARALHTKRWERTRRRTKTG